MSSAQEVETGASFINGNEPVMKNHKQGLSLLQFDSNCATGIITDMTQQKTIKLIDMRFYWMHYRTTQKQFLINWKRHETSSCDAS